MYESNINRKVSAIAGGSAIARSSHRLIESANGSERGLTKTYAHGAYLLRADDAR